MIYGNHNNIACCAKCTSYVSSSMGKVAEKNNGNQKAPLRLCTKTYIIMLVIVTYLQSVVVKMGTKYTVVAKCTTFSRHPLAGQNELLRTSTTTVMSITGE